MIENEPNKEVTLSIQTENFKMDLSVETEITNPNVELALTMQEYFDRGNEKIEHQDYEGAFTWFSNAIEIESKNSTACHQTGSTKILIRFREKDIVNITNTGEKPLFPWGCFLADGAPLFRGNQD
jgi:hypothetical protein